MIALKMKGDDIAVDLRPGLPIVQKLVPVIGGIIRGFTMLGFRSLCFDRWPQRYHWSHAKTQPGRAETERDVRSFYLFSKGPRTSNLKIKPPQGGMLAPQEP